MIKEYWILGRWKRRAPTYLTITLIQEFWMSNLRSNSGFTDLLKVKYVSNESERSFPQHCILSSTTLHSRSLPLMQTITYFKYMYAVFLHISAQTLRKGIAMKPSFETRVSWMGFCGYQYFCYEILLFFVSSYFSFFQISLIKSYGRLGRVVSISLLFLTPWSRWVVFKSGHCTIVTQI